MALTTVQQVQAAYLAIVRTPLNEASATAIAAAIDGGTLTYASYQAGLIAQVNTTTTAAVALSTFIEGVVPTSERVDSLTAFAKTQFDYYTNTLKSANAQLGAYEALGKAFAADASTSATFAARYGALSATDFVISAYASIFNAAPVPSAAALANLVSQIAYFTDLYTKAGIPAADAALQAKGAVLGQIIGYAATTSDPMLELSSLFDNNIEGLINLAADEARLEVTPSSVYGVGTLGVTIDLTVGPAATGVSPAGVFGRVSTQFGDKISGEIGVNGFADTIKIDGGAGVDTLTVGTLGLNYAPAADVIKSVEKLVVNTTGLVGSTVDVTNIKGLTDVSLGAGSAWDLTLKGVDSATNIHVAATLPAANLTVGYASAPTAAKISIDANYAGKIAFSDAAVKAVTADVTVAASGVNFADNDLTSVTVTSKGNVTLADVGTGLKTLDLSGVGTFSTSNFAGEGFANAVTVTLGKGADVFEIDANKAHSITLGLGADTVEFNQAGNVSDISTDAKLVASLASVTDFSKAQGDILRLEGGAQLALNATQLGQISGSSSLLAATTLAGTFTSGAADWAVFSFGSDTYGYFDAGNDGLNIGDTLIKVTGVPLTDFTAGTNLIVF